MSTTNNSRVQLDPVLLLCTLDCRLNCSLNVMMVISNGRSSTMQCQSGWSALEDSSPVIGSGAALLLQLPWLRVITVIFTLDGHRKWHTVLHPKASPTFLPVSGETPLKTWSWEGLLVLKVFFILFVYFTTHLSIVLDYSIVIKYFI